jgi:hypothetical protein
VGFETTIPASERAKTVHALDRWATVTATLKIYYINFLRRRNGQCHYVPKVDGVKGKAIPVTGREGPQRCETSRLPHFLDNRLTDGGKVVSLTRRPPFLPRKILGSHFC